MQNPATTPDQQIKQILEKLQLNSIDQLLQLEALSVNKIAQRTNLNGVQIEACLLHLHEIILSTQLLEKKVIATPPANQILIQMSKIYPQIHGNIEEGELFEVLGRANGGKTTFMINCMKQALQKNIQPILLSSSLNCTQQYLKQIDKQKLMIFPFKQVSDLAILIHALGNQILEKYIQQESDQVPHTNFIVFIDCLSEIDKEEENIELDCSEKFRRLLNTFTARTQTSIVYSYRVNNSLFQTQFKREQHRPKCKNSKEWDGWTNKNVMVDFVVRKKDMKRVNRIIFPKGFDNKLYEIVVELNNSERSQHQ